MAIHPKMPPRMQRYAPYAWASRPKASAPPKATNWISRMVAIRTPSPKPSCLAPYVDATPMTVWIPSL